MPAKIRSGKNLKFIRHSSLEHCRIQLHMCKIKEMAMPGVPQRLQTIIINQYHGYLRNL